MITGNQLKAAMIHAAILINNRRREVDELNVYPVPDGDTGTNMSMTISAAKRELELLQNNDVPASQVADTAASAMLRGARGNSGVILSLLFRGFSKGLSGLKEAGVADFANALELGVAGAYKAVMKPTEGTILTVSRMAASKAQELAKTDIDLLDFWQAICNEANDVLKQTTEMLPALKKANVVDAGGQGFCIIMEGMLESFRGEALPKETGERTGSVDPKEDFNSAVAQYDEEINFTYCTEYIVEKHTPSVDPAKLRAYLETIGDCVVVVDDDEIIKVHVHTDNPGLAITKALEFGSFINDPKPKIENMKIQHQNKVKEATIVRQQDFVPVEPTKEIGFVAVAAGPGLERSFLDLGVDQVVRGGQTMNPSTDDILRAIHATPAKTVFVLPNNKNIIMAAEQAVNLANRNVCVLQTRTIPQGIAAMLAYDDMADFQENRIQMAKAAEHVSTGSITFAARDSELDGHTIHKDEVLALDNGKLSFTEKDVNKAAYKLTRKMVKNDTSYVTIFYGADVTEEQSQRLKEMLSAKLNSRIELTLINGGQPVYYYFISVE